MKKIRKAKVLKTVSYPDSRSVTVVEADNGDRHYLVEGSANATKCAPGTKGTIEYRTDPGYSLWFFKEAA